MLHQFLWLCTGLERTLRQNSAKAKQVATYARHFGSQSDCGCLFSARTVSRLRICPKKYGHDTSKWAQERQKRMRSHAQLKIPISGLIGRTLHDFTGESLLLRTERASMRDSRDMHSSAVRAEASGSMNPPTAPAWLFHHISKRISHFHQAYPAQSSLKSTQIEF